MEVTQSGYYYWLKNKISSRKQIDHSVKGRYGSPRICEVLKDQGERVSRKRVSRLMRENNIAVKVKRRFKRTTDADHHSLIAANLLEQNFTVLRPNQVWCADITYLWTKEGWLYLVVI